jgi:hypothetical protein
LSVANLPTTNITREVLAKPWVRIVAKNGYSHTQWREPLPIIPPVILNSIIFTYRNAEDAELGVSEGGSGFLLAMNSVVSGFYHCYAVTNRHVIAHGFPAVRVNFRHDSSLATLTHCFPFLPQDWVIHPEHDLAVCPMPHDFDPNAFNVALLGIDYLMSRDFFQSKGIAPGDNLFYVGRFMEHAGRYENMPSVRFGNISMLPNELEPVEYEEEHGRQKQIGYLVEARSRSGYSGSPVFFYEQHSINRPRNVLMQFDVKILGVDWGHIQEEVVLIDRVTRHRLPSTALVHSGMMGVVPSWYLDDFIRTYPRMIEQRQRDVELYMQRPITGAPD